MRILIGVDDSRAAHVACEFVTGRAWATGTRVTLLGVVEPVFAWSGPGPLSGDGMEAESAALALVLDERADHLRRCGLTVDVAVEFGSAADHLIARATADFAGLIVVGSRGLGPAASLLMGSVSAYLVDHAQCPVLVARSPSASRMLLASDGTPSSRSIPSILAAWGSALRGLPVEVVSVAPRDMFITPWATEDDHQSDADLDLHESIARQMADEMMELGWHTAAVARVGDPGRKIVDVGREWGADLIVTGSRGVGTLERLVRGSVAHDVLLHARTSVLVVRGHVPARIGLAAERRAVLAVT